MRNVLKQLLYVAAIACLLSSVATHADSKKKKGFKAQAELSRAQEVPAADAGSGLIESASITADFEKDFSAVKVKLRVKGGDNAFAAHFHCGRAGENGPVSVTIFSGMGPLMFDGSEAKGTLTNADIPMSMCGGRPLNNIASLAFAMQDGLIYVNVHTSDNPGGEVRGQMQ